jgi:hypothetical protein
VWLIQRQLRTTVKVNGVTVFNEVPQPDAGGAVLGLVTHWTKGNSTTYSLRPCRPRH